MRRIAVVTTSRADFGIYRPLLRRLNEAAETDLALVVGGMHLDPSFGLTVQEIEGDGFPIAARVPMRLAGDTPRDVAQAMSGAVAGFAAALDQLGPDILVVLGDRYEMHAAALAAQSFPIAVAHIHGGELTLGAMDDALRHSMTKLSHLHFVATEAYGRRVRQMGEEAWRVSVCGALGLDNLRDVQPVTGSELERLIGLPLSPRPLLVTYHPETRGSLPIEDQAAELFAALDDTELPVVFTAPNADTGGGRLRALIEGHVSQRDHARLVDSLGTAAYFGLMSEAAAMVGNSSSGIIEAASFRLPVVNIGDRQEGRIRAKNVVDTPIARNAVIEAILRAVSPEFQKELTALANPYQGPRRASEIITECLATVRLGQVLLKKGFADLPHAESPESFP